MNINTEVKELLSRKRVSLNDGIPYLLGLHYGYAASYIPEDLKTTIFDADIIELKNGKVEWKVALFEEQQDTKFEWVIKEWIPMFEAVNPERKGIKRTAVSRMKKFFAENPNLRKTDVMDATRMYLSSVENPNYVITSHYFIEKGVGAAKTSALLEWCDKLEVARKSNTIRRGLNNTMR